MIRATQKQIMPLFTGVFFLGLLMILAPLAVTAGTKTTKLVFAHHIPALVPSNQLLVNWMKSIEQETNGQIQFKYYPSGTLVEGEEAFSAVISGICDITFLMMGYEPDRFPLNCVLTLPVLNFSFRDLADNNEIYDALIKKFPEMDKELEGVKVLWRWISVPNQIHLANKPIRLPTDLKGVKTICTGDIAVYLKACGASPVDLGSGDWYMSLERGMAEALLSMYSVMDSRGATELLRYHTHINLSSAPMAIVINKKVWNGLSPEVQKSMLKNGENARQADTTLTLQIENDAISKAKKLGHTFFELTPEEDDAWRKIAEAPSEKWIKAHEHLPNGHLLKEILKEAKRLIADQKR